MARARGCSERVSRPRTIARTSLSRPRVPVTWGSPRVRVPVLSTTSTSSLAACSSTRLFLINRPRLAARPSPTMIDMGMANPSAQGHAIMRTLMAVTSAKDNWGAGPRSNQARNVRSANPTTAGTNTALIRSITSATGGFEFCASATSLIIRPSSVSSPTASVRIVRLPSRLRVPANTRSPG